ncbi:MAG: nitrophenyl compound nitroreductase subunit ArsF family protein [Rikenellaceae bacterium]
MKKGILAVFALMILVSCVNNTNSKTNDKDCCSTETKSESCCGTETKSESCCGTETKSTENINCCGKEAKYAEAGKVEVLYMHGKQRCATCIAIGTETEAALKELNNENVVMKTIDISTAEGEKIADKYEITSSSLLIVKGDVVENLTVMSFQNARNNPEQFRKNLKESIQKLLE